MKICFVSPFPPRHDGISEFNYDLITGLQKNYKFDYFGVTINADNNLNLTYDKLIKYQIEKNNIKSYVNASKIINESDANIVCLQLELNLYGGYDGKYIIELVRNLKKKVVIVVHGSPINSYSRRPLVRKKFFRSISPFVSGFIVINPLQEKVFRSWGLKNKIKVIAHGAPDEILNYNQAICKNKLNLTDKTIIFNFGLIHKKKGLEYLLEGFRNYIQENDSKQTILILAGETLMNETDNSYLSSLRLYIKRNHLDKKVIIINKFLEKDEIYLYLSASDIIVFPYVKRNVVSSGPLSFAVEAKKFIITTPFPYAKTLLSRNEAYFVSYKNSKSIYNGINFYFKQKNAKVIQMLKKLENKSDNIKWSEIAKKYYSFFDEISRM